MGKARENNKNIPISTVYITMWIKKVTFNDPWGQTSYYEELATLLYLHLNKILLRSDFEQIKSLRRNGSFNIKVTFYGFWGHTSFYKKFASSQG